MPALLCTARWTVRAGVPKTALMSAVSGGWL